jgi:hypothetical protein
MSSGTWTHSGGVPSCTKRGGLESLTYFKGSQVIIITADNSHVGLQDYDRINPDVTSVAFMFCHTLQPQTYLSRGNMCVSPLFPNQLYTIALQANSLQFVWCKVLTQSLVVLTSVFGHLLPRQVNMARRRHSGSVRSYCSGINGRQSRFMEPSAVTP